MPDEIRVKKKRVRQDPDLVIGQGGEAVVYRLTPKTAVKIYRMPQDPHYQGDPHEQRMAQQRLETIQLKLPAFPKGLPDHVIQPIDLATDRSGQIRGFTMPLIDGAEVLKRFLQAKYRRNILQVSDQETVSMFMALHALIEALHKKEVVIGDFNPMNVLVQGLAPYLIDADSMQFGQFVTRTFTMDFVDPLLCRIKPDARGKPRPILNGTHNALSDWFAFAATLMEALLFVSPYGGVFKPKDKSQKVGRDLRRMSDISVFHDEVIYPKSVRPLHCLPDDLLQHFYQMFAQRARAPFPINLLQGVRWTECPTCGLAHSRPICPKCVQVHPQIRTMIVKKGIRADRIFDTTGRILYATVQNGHLKYLYHDGSAFKREDGRVVIQAGLRPRTHYGIKGKTTIMASGDRLIQFKPHESPQVTAGLDRFQGVTPMFTTNGDSLHWVAEGKLLRERAESGLLAGHPEEVTKVLPGNTAVWLGPRFGVGFYRAGQVFFPFIFFPSSRGVQESRQLVPPKGQLIEATCVFDGNHLCWFFFSTFHKGETTNHCQVIDDKGNVLGHHEAIDQDDESWLGTIHNKAALTSKRRSFLFAPTDQGLKRIELNHGQFMVTEFPGTGEIVNASTQIAMTRGGMLVIHDHSIWKLSMRKS